MIAATPLTAGQIRRRWRARAVAAAHAVPFWIVLMASLLVRDRKIMRRDKKLVDNNCTDCCGTPGCSDCPGHTCERCTVGASPQTPSQWHVTFSSVDTAMPCTACSGGGFIRDNGGTSVNGTYTLSQVGIAPVACSWEFITSGGPVVESGPNSDCSSPASSEDGIGVVLTQQPSSMNLFIDGGGLTYVVRTVEFFNSIVTTNDCCSPHTFTNDYTSYTCDGPPGGATAVMGINGTGVATPC